MKKSLVSMDYFLQEKVFNEKQVKYSKPRRVFFYKKMLIIKKLIIKVANKV